jgi:hypothetical protein
MLQDTWRFSFFASRRASAAFLNDAIWTGLFVALFFGAEAFGNLSVPLIILAWGTAGLVASAVGCIQSGLIPRVSLTVQWLKDSRDLGPRLAIESLALTGTWQAAFFLLGGIIGLAGLGSVKAAYTLFGPLNVLFFGITMLGIPEAARLVASAPGRLIERTTTTAALLVTISMVWTAVLLFLPPSVGRLFIGSLWPASSKLLMPMGLFMVGTGLQVGALVSLRGLGATRHSLGAALISSPLTLAIIAGGAAVYGVSGAAWGLAAGSFLFAALTWAAFDRARRAFLAGVNRSLLTKTSEDARAFASNA